MTTSNDSIYIDPGYQALGLREIQARAFAELEGNEAKALILARVVNLRRGSYLVASPAFESREPSGLASVTLSGALQYAAANPRDIPAVGDWVAVDEGLVIKALLPRSSCFARKESGRGSAEQILACNIDNALLVMACGDNYNPRRMERYLALSWDSGARPIIVLTKTDTVEEGELEALVCELEAIAFGAPVFAVASLEGRGVHELSAALASGSSSVLLGSSGAGKSTLLNALAGKPLMETADLSTLVGKGRHTTTSRELFSLDSGAMIIDTPGMRELGLSCGEDALENSFPDIEALARGCRFSDCAHSGEPGCAVRAALESGGLDEARFQSWVKLRKEIAWFATRTDQSAARAERAKWKAIARLQRELKKKS